MTRSILTLGIRTTATGSYISIRRTRLRVLSLSTALWICFWVTLLIPSSHGLGRKSDEKTASSADGSAWSLDLRSVGFTGFMPKGEQWGINLRPNPLCFTDNNVLAATFITREEVTSPARRDQPEALPLRLHGAFINAHTGKVRDTKEWSLTRPRGGIVPGNGGKFLVLTPATFALYSPELTLLKEFKLSPDRQAHLRDVHSSSAGKSVLVEYNECMPNCNPNPPKVGEYQKPDTSFQWVDTDSLQSQSAWRDSLPGVAISDSTIAISRETFVKSQGFIHEVLLRARDGSERTVCRVVVGHGDSCGYPEFLSNDVLALWMPHQLSIVPKTGGDELLKANFREDEWLGRPLHPSMDGKRFAVTVWAHKGGECVLRYRLSQCAEAHPDLRPAESTGGLHPRREGAEDQGCVRCCAIA